MADESTDDVQDQIAETVAGLLGTEDAPTAPVQEAVVDEPTTDTVDALDSLLEGQDEGESDESEDEGQKPLHTHPRFKQLIEQKNSAQKAVEERDETIADLETQLEENEALSSTFLKMYEEFENPAEQLRYNTALADAITKVYDANQGHPAVESVLDLVQKVMKTGGVGNMAKDNNAEERQTSQSDDRLTKVLRNQWAKETEGVLTTTKIRPELHAILKDEVLSNVDVNKDPDSGQVKAQIKSYIESKGWDVEFLTGGKATTAGEGPPTAGSGRSANAPKASTGKQTSQQNADETTDPEELRSQLRTRFAQLMNE
jgi:hypothetical protein